MRKREDALHGAFAIALFADDRAAAMIADGSGEDLAGAGRIVIDEHDQRHAPSAGDFALMIEIFPRAAAAGGDDQPIIDKPIGHLDRRLQQSARVAAEVDNELLHPLLVQLPQGRIHVAAGGLLKARQLEIADAKLADREF